MKRKIGAVAVVSALIVGARPAAAEPATALDRLQPAPAGDAFVAVPAAGVADGARPAGAVLVSWARDPLRLRVRKSEGGSTQQVVSDQVIAHALVSFELRRRLLLEADLPVALAQRGDGSPAATLPAPGGAGPGDVRLGARVVVARQSGWRPAVALAASVWLPTGTGGAYNGAPGVRAAPGLVVGADTGRFVWSLGASRRLQAQERESLQASEIAASAAAAVRLGPVQVGPEFWVQRATSPAPLDRGANRTGAEALLAARYRVGPAVLSLAGGPGLGSQPGSPAYRLLAGVAFAAPADPEPPPPANDPPPATAAGPDDPAAAAPPAAGPGGADVSGTSGQSSPLPPAPPPPAPPPDGDGDGIADAEDACPAAAGVASLDGARNGCPADTDGDGIVDARDACPRERGEAAAEPTQNGCPKAVRVQGEQIVILQQVVFKTGRAEIDPSSFGLLQQVSDVLAQHPEIARLAVDGHTDSSGAERANVELSRRRAAAVLRWMTEHGVDARRLEARGFGPRRPLADNKTEEGRSRNRRVEFQILRRTTRGEAGWGEERAATP